MKRKIASILGFAIGDIPSKHLGAPLFQGACKMDHWVETIAKCRSKAEAWKGKWLSLARRILMIKSVLAVVPIYVMSCFGMTHKAISDVESFMKRFLWEGEKDCKHIPLLN